MIKTTSSSLGELATLPNPKKHIQKIKQNAETEEYALRNVENKKSKKELSETQMSNMPHNLK